MTPSTRVPIDSPPPVHVWTWPARLLTPKDGDTLVVALDRGDRDGSEWELRFAGINCPEKGTPEGSAATAFTMAWMAEATARATGPWPLLMRTYKESRPREKYGRYLMVVWRQGDPVSLNQALLNAGHAAPYDP